MRRIVAGLVVVLLGVCDSSFAMSEWIWHKTHNGRHPNDGEQQQIWLINRARANPNAEGRWLANSREPDIAYGRESLNVNIAKLRADFRQIKPKPPVAHDVRLYQAARSHSLALIARDSQDHVGQLGRIDAAGFIWTQFRGNVFSYAYNDLNAHAAFNIDWGKPGSPYGMQDPPQHRKAIMGTDGNYSNVGVATIYDTNTANSVGPYVITQNFAKAVVMPGEQYNTFVVGTVWSDNNQNRRYDPGEGLRNVTVMPSTGKYYALTAEGGGYAIPLTEAGSMTLHFAGADAPYHAKIINAGATSLLVDYEIKSDLRSERDITEQPPVRLFRNSPTTEKYGYGFGRSTHRDFVVAEFQNPGVDSFLSVRGYDIDSRQEIDVLLNDKPLGNLNATEDGKLGVATRFFIKTADLQQNNKIEFRQRVPGEVWGIYDIALLDDRPATTRLEPEILDWHRHGSTGLTWSGDTRLIATFENTGQDFMLSARTQLIEGPRSVEVRLNDKRIGWMLPAASLLEKRRTNFSIPASTLIEGTNAIEFRPRSAQWIVTDLKLRDNTGPTVVLEPQVQDSASYGWLHGTSEHRTVLRSSFTADRQDLALSFDSVGPDSEYPLEIYLNNEHVGTVKSDPGTKKWSSNRLALDPGLIVAGRNDIEFRRDAQFRTPWGVRNLLISN